SHGFEKEKSIITNAERHRGKTLLLNIDLEDYFDSFNFGRVRGFFLSNRDFRLNNTVATTIAQIACFQNGLPQGSPCSPIISNLISGILDIRLSKLAKKYGCNYSRYADDLTFSTNKKTFPKEIADVGGESVTLSPTLIKEIIKAGFKINDKKTRVCYKTSRQDVTGLTVNKKVNVGKEYAKVTRAMAHSLYKDGSFVIVTESGKIEKGTCAKLEGRFGFIDSIDKYNNLKLKNARQLEKYQSVNHGLNYTAKLNSREKAYSYFLYYKNFHGMEMPTILTEGKTDRVYLKCALKSLANSYPLLFNSSDDSSKNEYRVNFFKATEKTSYFLDISGGATDFKRFILRYQEQKKRFEKFKPKHPVIMLLDNDSGPKDLLNHLKDKVKNCPNDVDTIRKARYTHIFDNLYLLLTPLLPGGKESCMEDLFDSTVLSTVLDGKTFNKSNDTDTKTEYGKHVFSTKVIKANCKTISFEKFKVIFDGIEEIIADYSKRCKV
ncbi:retron Ec67 family RNA-directed DNA polymerase/endonuclease, partial [Escherichia coli]